MPRQTVALRNLVTKPGNGHELVGDTRVKAPEATAFADKLKHVYPASDKRDRILLCEDCILTARQQHIKLAGCGVRMIVMKKNGRKSAPSALLKQQLGVKRQDDACIVRAFVYP